MTDIVLLLSGVSANTTGTAIDAGDLKATEALEVFTGGTVSAFSVQLQGSLDDVNWAAIGSAVTTATTSAITGGPLARYFRAVLSGYSGTGTVSARLGYSAAGAAGGGSGGGISPPAGDLGGTTSAPTVAKIQGTAVGSPPGGTTQFLRGDGTWQVPAGSLVIDATASDIQASGVQAAGSKGQAADAKHVHQNYAQLSTYLAPTGATAQTFDRALTGTVATPVSASGTLLLRAIGLPAGLPVNTITFLTGGTAEASGTHCWAVLLDSGYVVRAVSADNTGAAFFTGTQGTPIAFSVSGSAYTTSTGGIYYVGICTVAGTPPSVFAGSSTASGITTLTPPLMGLSSTGQTTPPSVGTTMTAPNGTGSYNLYAYLS